MGATPVRYNLMAAVLVLTKVRTFLALILALLALPLCVAAVLLAGPAVPTPASSANEACCTGQLAERRVAAANAACLRVGAMTVDLVDALSPRFYKFRLPTSPLYGGKATTPPETKSSTCW